MSQIVYTRCTGTVTIDYDASLKLFVSRRQQFPFSPEKLLTMLNYRASQQRVTLAACLYVRVCGVTCILTEHAVQQLKHLHVQRPEWSLNYPHISAMLSAES